MTTPTENFNVSTTARAATRFIVRRGDEEGNEPGVSEETEELRVITINRFAGARRIDHCEFAYDLGATGQRLEDLQTPENWSRQIEVRVPDPDDPILSSEALFWGELSAQNLRLGRGEEATVIASLEPFHFGDVLTGVPIFDSAREVSLYSVDLDPIFNPLIDAKIEPNRDEQTNADVDSSVGEEDPVHYLWLDPERVRTPGSKSTHGAGTTITPQLWTIPDAIAAISAICNPDETFIKNPVIDDSDTLLWGDDVPALNNVRLRRGRYLPEYLDTLLQPYGYDWFVDVSLDESNDFVRQIVIFRRGVGDEVEIFFQPIGDSLDLTQQNVQELRLDTSIADMANQVTAHGSREQFEVTVPLLRAWPDGGGEDDLTRDDLAKSDGDEPPGENAVFAANPNVFRLYVGGEAGDLLNLRSDSPSFPPDFAAEIDGLFPAKRRSLERCLAYDKNGKRLPPLLEYSLDAGVTWNVWDKNEDQEFGPYKVLTDQIGIYFDGGRPPAALINAGDDGRLRITGTITSDSRVFATASRRDTSPNLRDVELFLDVSDKFHRRFVQNTGTFASSLLGNGNGADETNDSTALDTWVTTLRDVEDSAGMTARIDLHGLHFDARISDLITKVAGREISFNRNSPSSETKKYLQIAGISYDLQSQVTTLHVVAVEDR